LVGNAGKKRRHNQVKIAITIWGNRISPVFDSARTLMIAQVENLKIINRRYEDFHLKNTDQIPSSLNDLQIDILICGAITDAQVKAVEKAGIQLVSFISGNIEKVLMSLLKKPHGMSEFLMPGGTSDLSIKL
jgi:predicted Fe-Mo cluster-binding NifX family protein